jgi:DNA processing protein
MGVRPERRRFPLRNRLISGMAQAVVVVEGAVDSGSRITAAREQQREVYAVSGSVFATGSRGPHHLLTEGARVLRNPPELFERLGIAHPPQAAGTSEEPLSEDEARVVAVLGETVAHIDGIIERSRLGAGRVAGALATLEVRGIVRQSPGKRFAKPSGFRETVQESAGGDWWLNPLSS